MRCSRRFEPVLGGAWIQLTARWELGPSRTYDEIALFGRGRDGDLIFSSFTSDGKCSRGAAAEAAEIDPQAIAFEAQMPQGLARMVYWPAPEDRLNFAVESRTKKGWNRFVHHLYRPVAGES